jgi:hypothetical protein
MGANARSREERGEGNWYGKRADCGRLAFPSNSSSKVLQSAYPQWEMESESDRSVGSMRVLSAGHAQVGEIEPSCPTLQALTDLRNKNKEQK